MILKSRTRNEKIRDNIFDCIIILLSFGWRSIASIFMSLLAIGAAEGQSGEPHQWFIQLTTLMLFFCPWGSPKRRELREIYRDYLVRGRAREMKAQNILYWYEITFKIKRTSLFIDLILLLGDIYINGVLGIIFGWRILIIMYKNFVWSVQDIGRLIKT